MLSSGLIVALWKIRDIITLQLKGNKTCTAKQDYRLNEMTSVLTYEGATPPLELNLSRFYSRSADTKPSPFLEDPVAHSVQIKKKKRVYSF